MATDIVDMDEARDMDTLYMLQGDEDVGDQTHTPV